MGIGFNMRIIKKQRLIDFWERYPDTEQPLKAWYKETTKARWKNPQRIKGQYATASILQNGRVVFNVLGNNYRLVVSIRYDLGIVYIRFIGTHKQYDNIDAQTI